MRRPNCASCRSSRPSPASRWAFDRTRIDLDARTVRSPARRQLPNIDVNDIESFPRYFGGPFEGKIDALFFERRALPDLAIPPSIVKEPLMVILPSDHQSSPRLNDQSHRGLVRRNIRVVSHTAPVRVRYRRLL